MKKAIIYMIISALSFALLNVGVKCLDGFIVSQIVFFRALGSLVFTYPYLITKKIPILGNKKGLLIARSIVGLIAMTLFFASLKIIPAGTAVSIRYIAPVFAAVFAYFILKEKIKPIQWLFFSGAFVGVLLLKGIEYQINLTGFIFAIISAIFTGLVFIIIRKIGDKDHPIVIVNYFMTFSVVISGVLCVKYWSSPVGIDWLVLLSLGITGYFGQLYMTKAFQQSETKLIAPLKYIEVIFTILAGVLWFSEGYNLYTILGIILVVICLSLNVIVVKKGKR